jgi:hypothetical protein
VTADDYDELVARYILREYRDDNTGHLAECPETRVTDSDAQNGSYGCETGCAYARFEAVVDCPHGQREEFAWGQFGELADILDDLTRLELMGDG